MFPELGRDGLNILDSRLRRGRVTQELFAHVAPKGLVLVRLFPTVKVCSVYFIKNKLHGTVQSRKTSIRTIA